MPIMPFLGWTLESLGGCQAIYVSTIAVAVYLLNILVSTILYYHYCFCSLLFRGVPRTLFFSV